MSQFRIVVLAKQVPDTRNVGKDAMKSDGTINRAALPAIFNPEDLNALEQALRIKDEYPQSSITVITMGPGRAAEVLREGMYRGADDGVLLTDRRFGGADTLATSYTLARGIEKMDYDLVIAGRQAIDGDTAQVGPQIAEKLNIPQITYATEVSINENKEVTAKRTLENGTEVVKGKMPLLITVHSSAPECRKRNAKRVMKYKHAKTPTECQNASEDYLQLTQDRPYLQLSEWSSEEIGIDSSRIGLKGSPTKVKTVESVVLTSKESTRLQNKDEDIDWLMQDLINNHTID